MEAEQGYQCVECGGTFQAVEGYDDAGAFVCTTCHDMRSAARAALKAGPAAGVRVPDYAGLRGRAAVLRFFAFLGYGLGVLGVVMSIPTMIAAVREPMEGTTFREWVLSDQLRRERLVAISSGIVVSLGLVFAGAVVHLLSHIGLAVRDIARNSYRR